MVSDRGGRKVEEVLRHTQVLVAQAVVPGPNSCRGGPGAGDLERRILSGVDTDQSRVLGQSGGRDNPLGSGDSFLDGLTVVRTIDDMVIGAIQKRARSGSKCGGETSASRPIPWLAIARAATPMFPGRWGAPRRW